MAEKIYRDFIGVVQFEPRDGDVQGKAVRNIAIRTVGVKEQSMRVSCTLWPSHAHVEVEKGDLVMVEGSFTANDGEKDGKPVKYFNLSVAGFKNLGPMDFGEQIERTAAPRAAEPPEDDQVPY